MRALLALLLVLAAPALAQAPAQLVADEVFVAPDRTLTATGRVEVLRDGTRLTASSVRYDPDADRLTIEGPIRISEGGGDVILADAADLSPDLREGIVTGARLVIDRQLQLAAAALVQAGPRYTALSRVTASACTVCAANPTPLWEIRADRVIQDREARLIYFRDAQFRLLGVPIAFLPALRVPGPGNDRAAGFLTPEFRSTSRLGTGVRLPYFLPLGPSRDLTITPYLASGTRTVDLRWRQALRFGTYRISLGASRDDVRDGPRGYLLAEGSFDLPRGFRLSAAARTASDDAYLADYGLSDADRLESGFTITRTRADDYAEARLVGYRSLRASEGDTVPDAAATLLYDRRFAFHGGDLDMRIDALRYRRDLDTPVDLPGGDADVIADGRDGARVTARLDWARTFSRGGLRVTPIGRLEATAFGVEDDAARYDGTRLAPTAGVDLRWIGSRATAGASWLVEPRAQLLWTGGAGDYPNEDSVRVELDAGNLFALSRFPGGDAVETGARANIGVTLTRSGPEATTSLTLGRVLRPDDPGLFPDGSGLAGRSSDWLLETSLATGRLAATGRVLFDDTLEVTRNETRLTYSGPTAALTGGFVYARGHRALDGSRRPRVSEMTLDGTLDLTRTWDASFGMRWDFFANRAQEARVGARWRGDCAEMELTAEREFTAASALSPETRVGVSFALTGFGDRPARRTRACGPAG
ncbi:LPS-assembly protein [Hasllibacter halocynthiae]|uniref:LPS-assembly protein LptD n=1 Tax=Hasllibacter halocynthiae TaxID=595589 RepID=A0A2T0X7T4_9RHOB|nr:LPS assembly protein LptD [Hasllibacter halocynthiae]PRY94955.1 LPS-assembly protein [Hasllibacter halocynthiae]